MDKLDRSKPYGIVSGSPGAHFEQNGKLYTGTGEPLRASETVEPEIVERVEPMEEVKKYVAPRWTAGKRSRKS